MKKDRETIETLRAHNAQSFDENKQFFSVYCLDLQWGMLWDFMFFPLALCECVLTCMCGLRMLSETGRGAVSITIKQ